MIGAINKDPDLRERMIEDRFEATAITPEMVPAFMKERGPQYPNSGRKPGLIE
jgi:hypothetical protein